MSAKNPCILEIRVASDVDVLWNGASILNVPKGGKMQCGRPARSVLKCLIMKYDDGPVLYTDIESEISDNKIKRDSYGKVIAASAGMRANNVSQALPELYAYLFPTTPNTTWPKCIESPDGVTLLTLDKIGRDKLKLTVAGSDAGVCVDVWKQQSRERTEPRSGGASWSEAVVTPVQLSSFYGSYKAVTEPLWIQVPARYQRLMGGMTVDHMAAAKVGFRDQRAEPPLVLDDAMESCEQPAAECGAARLVVLGEAGDGLTTMVRKSSLMSLRAGNTPIVFSASAWARSNKNSIHEFIEADYLASLDLVEFASQLKHAIATGSATVFIDSMDEVDIETRQRLVVAISEFALGYGKSTRIVVVCRRAAYEEVMLADFRVAEFSPLQCASDSTSGDNQVTHFVGQRLEGKAADKFLGELRRDPRAMELAGNGLLLAMMTFLRDQNPSPLPGSRADLYMQVIGHLLTYAPRDKEHNKIGPELILTSLSQIAGHSMLCRNARPITHQDALLGVAPIASHRAEHERQQHASDVIDFIVRETSLLVPTDAAFNPPEQYSYLRPSFREYFTAKWLADCWRLADESGDSTASSLAHWAPRCAICRSDSKPISDMIDHAEYEETLLLLANILNNKKRESALLSCLASRPERVLEAASRCTHSHPELVAQAVDKVISTYDLANEMPAICISALSAMRSNRNPTNRQENLRAAEVTARRLLGGAQSTIQKNAAIILGELRDTEAIEALVAAFENTSYYPDVRFEAASAVCKIHATEPVAVTRCISAKASLYAAKLQYQDRQEPVRTPERVRLGAVMLLGLLNVQPANAALHEALKSASSALFKAAAEALTKNRYVGAYSALESRLSTDPDEWVRVTIAMVLGTVNEPQTNQILVRAMSNNSKRVRGVATDALILNRYDDVYGALEFMLMNVTDDDVAVSAVMVLAASNVSSANEALIKYLQVEGKPEGRRDEAGRVTWACIEALAGNRYAPATTLLMHLGDKAEDPRIRSAAALAVKAIVGSGAD